MAILRLISPSAQLNSNARSYYPWCVGLVSGAAMSLCGHTGDRRHWGDGPALCSGYWQETEEVCRRHTDRDQWHGMGGYSDICAGSRALWSLLLTDLALIMWSLTALETMQLLISILTKGSMFSVYTVTAPATTMTQWPRLVTGDWHSQHCHKHNQWTADVCSNGI